MLTHEDEVEPAQTFGVRCGVGLRVAGAHQHDVAVVDQRLVRGAFDAGQEAEREVDLPGVERLLGSAPSRAETNRRARRAQPAARRASARQEDAFAHVAHVAKLALCAGLKASASSSALERLQRARHRQRQLVGARRRPHASAGAHEERVLHHQPKPGQRMAHGGLRQAELLGGAAHLAMAVHGVEDAQQVEVEVSDMHGIDST
jgi:hypothetical protein